MGRRLDPKAVPVVSSARVAAAASFLAAAHRAGYRGERALRRYAMGRNAARRHPSAYVSTDLLAVAVALEAAHETAREQKGTPPMSCNHDPRCPLVDVPSTVGVVAVRACVLEAQA